MIFTIAEYGSISQPLYPELVKIDKILPSFKTCKRIMEEDQPTRKRIWKIKTILRGAKIKDTSELCSFVLFYTYCPLIWLFLSKLVNTEINATR